MSRLLERVRAGEILISDGGTGTYLQSHGLDAGGCPEALNADNPEVIRRMARDYFAAGSDMVETNSFGGTWFVLRKYGHEEQVEKLNRLAAEHVRAGLPEGCFVLGSIGPSGEMLAPAGTISETEMHTAFAEQARGLAAGGVDAFCIETMSDVGETTVAIRAAREMADLPVIASMTFDQGPRGYFTMMGATPAAAAERLAEAGADIVGSNCGIPIESMIEIVAAMRAATDLPILTHINAGTPRVEQGGTVYPDTPEHMASLLPKVVEAGAGIIGGCCGTGPDHIRAFVRALEDAGLRRPRERAGETA